MKFKTTILLSLISLLSLTVAKAQEDDPILPYKVAPQNLLKFNRFLINPTFSTVREDKSYINLLHRNQSALYEDNDQTYFLSYSGRISDRTGLGLSLYNQSIGPVSNTGVLANLGYGVRLSENSVLSFGTNLAYYVTGLNQNDINLVDPNDFRIQGTQNSSILSIQPGLNLALGAFDIGVFAENLFDYNFETGETLIDDFGSKTYSGHLQYTHRFENSTGIMEAARLMPLARIRLNDQRILFSDGDQDITYGGSLILDLPKLGWLQGGYDSFYGASAGVGFNVNKRLSLGYTMEKGFTTDFDNLGVTHEISFAYSFTPNLTEDRVFLENSDDNLVDLNEELQEEALVTNNDELEELRKKLAENDAIIAELMFRQDSLEANRKIDLERRFEMVMRMVRNETKGQRPDLEKRAEQLFLGADSDIVIATNNPNNDGRETKQTKKYTKQSKKDAVASNTVKTTQPRIETNTVVNKPVFTHTQQTNKVKDAVVAANTRANTRPMSTKDNTQNTTNVTPSNQTKIKSRRFRNLDGVQDGYYVVANVYKGGQYMHKFIDGLEQKGILADYIDNPNNGLKYVYLERYDTWQEAVDAHKSNLNGSYKGEMWIMNIDNRYTNEAYVDNVNRIKDKSSRYNTDVLQQNVIVKDKVAATKQEPRTAVINGVDSGYYIIANVFANPKNANRFVKLLNSYGLNASYFINPENNWRYVYLKRHRSWNNALISYYNKLNDSYDDKMWIMRVTPNQLA